MRSWTLALGLSLLVSQACGTARLATVTPQCDDSAVVSPAGARYAPTQATSLDGSYDVMAWLVGGEVSSSEGVARGRLILSQPTEEDSALSVNALGNRTIVPVGGTDLNLGRLFGVEFPIRKWRHNPALSPVFGGYVEKDSAFNIALAFGLHYSLGLSIREVGDRSISGTWNATWEIGEESKRAYGAFCGKRVP